MTASPRTRDFAAGLGLFGGALGIVAGIVQAAVGDRIPDWSGGKSNPGGLGLLTVSLSVVAVVSARTLRGPGAHPPQRRLAAVMGLFVPAALCFSTVGRLWYLPGGLLLAAVVLAAGRPSELRAVVSDNWLKALLSILGGFELLMAVSAAPTITVAVGIVGGVALMAAPWSAGRFPLRASLLLLGTLPFMLLTWSSIATPLLAAVAFGIGAAVLRRARITGTDRPAPVPVEAPAQRRGSTAVRR